MSWEAYEKRLLFLALCLLFVVLITYYLGLGGCAHQMPVAPLRLDMAQPDMVIPYRHCTGSQQFDSTCRGMLTAEGYQYMLCSGDVSCLDLKNLIYCVPICLPDEHTRTP